MASRRKQSASTPQAELPEPVSEVNGWKIFAHPVFIQQLEALVEEVEKLRDDDPKDYRQKKKTKLLAAILKMAFEVIPANPADTKFQQGNTLGKTYRHWFRGKFFEGRYRLFYRFDSTSKTIVLAWVNDDETLRTYGGKKDAYSVFRTMLTKGRPPDEWKTLFEQAGEATGASKALLHRGRKAR